MVLTQSTRSKVERMTAFLFGAAQMFLVLGLFGLLRHI